MPFFTCELSGETIEKDVVVTPSGHICRRSLLLKALSENGAKDPFHPDRPLAEDDLIVLQQASSGAALSGIPFATSTTTNNNKNHMTMTATLQQLQSEYDAVVLDLYETRRLLQETRQELTQALYQNDAAVRVVARLALERDQARAARQQEWATTTKNVDEATADNNNDQPPPPAAKKAKLQDNITNAIPEADLQLMTQAWEESHKTRKARQKAKKAPSVAHWKLLANVAQKGNFQTTSTSSDGSATPVTTAAALALNDPSKLVTVVSNQSLVQYDTSVEAEDQLLSLTIGTLSSSSTGAGVVDAADSTIVVGLNNGSIDWLDTSNNNNNAHTCSICTADAATIVDVRLHPDGQHCVATTSNGSIALLSRPGTVVARLEHPDNSNGGAIRYSAGALHPDGLIYVAGTSDGALCLWDFNKQAVSNTLETTNAGAVTAVAASNNGYHVAAAYANATVVLWDLRKRSILLTWNSQDDDGENVLTSVTAVQFDDSGKYLAYSGTRSQNSVVVNVVEVKKGSQVAQFEAEGYTAAHSRGLVWGDAWIAVAAVESETSRPRALFFGL